MLLVNTKTTKMLDFPLKNKLNNISEFETLCHLFYIRKKMELYTILNFLAAKH